MDAYPATCFELAPRTARRMDAAQGQELVVVSGRVWLTFSDYSEDVFLSAGHALRLGPGAVVECDGAEAARLQLVRAESGWQRAAGRLGAAWARLARRLPGLRPAGLGRAAADGG